jgi:hypothetical protein
LSETALLAAAVPTDKAAAALMVVRMVVRLSA